MSRFSDAQKELEALAFRFIPRLRDVFILLMQDIVDEAVLRDVITAVKTGDSIAAFKVMGLSDAAMRPMTRLIEEAFEKGGITVGETFPKRLKLSDGTSAVFRFDVRNSRAEMFLRETSSKLIVEIQEQTRTVIRNTLTRGMTEGQNPRNVALDIIGRVDNQTGQRVGGVIGLTVQQEGWVASAKRDLEELNPKYLDRKLRDKRFDGIVKRAIENGKKLSRDEVEKLISRYKSNALRYRGEMIGRTEMLRALNQSEFEAINQAVAMGAIKASAVSRIWDSAGPDGRTRPTHLAMEGQTVGHGEPFVFPLGHGMAMYPGDVSLGAKASELILCRCKTKTRIDWLADAVEYAKGIPEADKAAIRALATAKLPGE